MPSQTHRHIYRNETDIRLLIPEQVFCIDYETFVFLLFVFLYEAVDGFVLPVAGGFYFYRNNPFVFHNQEIDFILLFRGTILLLIKKFVKI